MVITILTFCNGMYSSANTPGKNALIVGWAAVSYILWGMCYTVGDIPLWGVTSRMTEVEKDRASILSFARIAAGLGGGIGALSVLQSVMIADAVDYEEYHKGYRPDGVFFSGQSFITKLSAGISSIIQGVGYSIVGFSGDNVSACNEALRAGASFKDQFPQYAGMMFFLCSIPPAIGLFLSIIPLRHYGMTDEEHRTILEALVQRRNAQTEETADN